MENIAGTLPCFAASSNRVRARGWSRSPPMPCSSSSVSSITARIDQAARRGALDPAAPVHRVLVEATPFQQHPAIPVLRVDDAVGGAAQPLGRLAFVALHADALGQADARNYRPRPGRRRRRPVRTTRWRDARPPQSRHRPAPDWPGHCRTPHRRPRRRCGTSARPASGSRAMPAPVRFIMASARAADLWPASAARRNQVAASV